MRSSTRCGACTTLSMQRSGRRRRSMPSPRGKPRSCRLMENAPELDVAELDFDFVFSLEDPDSARVRSVGRGRLLLAGGLLALAAATSAGVPAARPSLLREVDE